MSKGRTSGQSAGTRATAPNQDAAAGEQGVRPFVRPARGWPRGGGSSPRPARRKETFSAEQAREFAGKIRRMRREEMYFWLCVAIVTLLCTFALMAWGPQDGYFLAGCLVAFSIATGFLHMQIIDHRCPNCRKELTPSGRYAKGTLDGDACPRCHAPFVHIENDHL
jgi:hypothetical protein